MLDQPPAPLDDHHDLVRRLRSSGKRLHANVRASVLALGDAAVPVLLEILDASENDDGWGPIHAADLLVQLRAEVSMTPMLKVLSKVDEGDVMRQTLEEALVEIGSAAMEPTLRAHVDSTDNIYRDSLCTVLAELGIRNDRIFACLIEQFERNIDLGAMSLAEYGDPRAIKHLSAAFDRYEVDPSPGAFANQSTIELKAAIEELGGNLSRAQQRKYRQSQKSSDQWRRKLRAALSGRAESRRGKLGRNEPCWCGNGKKYKKCHLWPDETERT